MLAAAAWRIELSFGRMLWLDELYTTTLIGAPDLGRLWDAALRGVDGNPPLYMSLAWLLAPAAHAEPERILRSANLALMAATAVLMYRLGRRLAAPASVAAALALLPAVDGTVGFALLEVRTYALYLFLVTATLWAALRVVDRPLPGRAALLSAVAVLATLAHSFGGFYALAAIGAASLACLASGREPSRRRAAATLVVAAVPAAVALAGWVAVSLPAQMAVATPYSWIPQPGIVELLQALTGSGLTSLVILASAAVCLPFAAVRAPQMFRRLCARHPRADILALHAAMAAYAALTLAGWLGSQVITPFFVPRYFGPNLLIAALVIVQVAEAVRRQIGPSLAAAAVVGCGLLGMYSLAQLDARNMIPCRDAGGRFLEEDAARDGTPVIVASPHAWFPRARYAPAQATLFPLDWDVVVDRPYQARNNAVDYHIMDILRGWAPTGSALATEIVPTADLMARHRRFLVLDEAGRSWFDELRGRRAVSATLIKEGAGCRLWAVDASP